VKLAKEQIEKGKWPLLKHVVAFNELVVLKQNDLSQFFINYGLHLIEVENSIINQMCRLVMKIYAINSGVGGEIFTAAKRLEYLEKVNFNFLLKNYKSLHRRRIFIPKGKSEKYLLGIPTILDRIIQS